MDAQMPGLSGAALIASSARKARPDLCISAASCRKMSPLPRRFPAQAVRYRKPAQAARGAAGVQSVAARSTDPVLNAEILAQFRKLMPEPAVRQIYTAVIDDSLSASMTGVAIAKATPPSAPHRHAIKGSCECRSVQVAHLGALLEATPSGKG